MGKAAGRQTWTYTDGAWHEGSPPSVAVDAHAMWLSSVVFDGARAFDGCAPDLDRHCARVITSGNLLGLRSPLTAAEITALAWEGIERFPAEAALYICPMLFAENGFIVPEPESTRFALTVRESPLPAAGGFSAALSPFRRPARDMAPTEAKAACLYPNVARASREAAERGFDTAVVLDPVGNVAEFAYQNLFFASDGAVHTPATNGTFLNGLTRQRVIALLREAGIEVVERAIDFAEVLAADEVFATGNYGKVLPCTRLENRELQPGPAYRRARALYFDWARSCTRPEPI